MEKDIGDLRSQLVGDEDQIAELELSSENKHDHILMLEAELKVVQTELVTRLKEVEHLKVILSAGSMHSSD